MPSDDEGFEITGAKGPNVRPAPKPRRSARTKLPPIPKIPSPSRESFEVAAESSSAATKRASASPAAKRKRTSRSLGSESAAEQDELEEGPKRRYKKPFTSTKAPRSSPSKTTPKEKKEQKEAKPKKLSQAALLRNKTQELQDDEHFGKLPEATIKRIAKAHVERLYLIHRFRHGTTLREEFDVFGSKGNVYKVALAQNVECSCMDFALQRRPCKHILFVYIKVLRLAGHLPVYSRVRLSNSELETIFAEARMDPVAEAMAHKGVRRAWENAVGFDPNAASSSSSESMSGEEGKRIIPEEGDMCGVCYEDLEPGSTEGLEFCLKSCGRPIHSDCLQKWFDSRGFARTCIWCRAKWDGAAEARKDPHADGYGIGVGRHGSVVDERGNVLNLAAAAAAAAALEPADEPEPADAPEPAATDATTGWE